MPASSVCSRVTVMSEGVISVVAALIRDEAGRVLLVRKRGTHAFMQPGGKRDAGEGDIAALAREVVEELGCCVDQRSARAVGVFECAAANESGCRANHRGTARNGGLCGPF